jgi:hypothetical protein
VKWRGEELMLAAVMKGGRVDRKIRSQERVREE